MEDLFGEKRKLILPIILDIANIIKTVTTNQHASQETNYHANRFHHILKRGLQLLLPINDNLFKDATANTIKQNSRQKRSPNPKNSTITDPKRSSNYSQIVPKQTGTSNAQSNVHVTLPNLANHTLTLDEYEDLALSELNSPDLENVTGIFNSTGNGTLPEAAMLISGRIRYPAHNKIHPNKNRSCELFGNICIRVEDYPM